jgi:hypothetical protein
MLAVVIRLYLDLLRLQEAVAVGELAILEPEAEQGLVAVLVAVEVTTILD